MPKLKVLVWVIPWSLLAGLLLTLVFVAQMHWENLSGCGQAASAPYRPYSLPGGCTTLDEGYPLRFLSSFPVLEQNPGAPVRTASLGSVPVIDTGNLVKDWFVWSLVSCPVLYVLGLRFSARRRPDAVPEGVQAHNAA